MEPKIIYTKHAELKIKQRGIAKSYIEKTIKKPTRIILEKDKFLAHRKFKKLYLKIIFKRINDSILVITAHWAKKI